ncbi:uncharacterized protein B0H18DRAFT_1214481 [Fomitopsis serialis]|uniref:uncharacterized protein n=1 Tax=Fomitopsis serialis TaxID=139415 RepID=UPI002007D7BF|nr:uncharacterized protein B0H18DRAFT_1214481 [Neoantrodia serialis]KAH9917733.1 hypothetical protein B0H18DRAFT_1214481 [Neoantrodia serialis]
MIAEPHVPTNEELDSADVLIYESSDEESQVRPVRQVYCCPAFLKGMAGPNSGAVLADQLIAQTLADYISVMESRPELLLDDADHRVARLFRALKVCTKDMNRYYAQAQEIAPAALPPAGGVIGSYGPAYTTTRTTETPIMTTITKTETRTIITTTTTTTTTATTTTTYMLVEFVYPAYNRAALELLTALEPAHIASLWTAVRTLHERGFELGDLRHPKEPTIGR